MVLTSPLPARKFAPTSTEQILRDATKYHDRSDATRTAKWNKRLCSEAPVCIVQYDVKTKDFRVYNAP